ncbi:MAG: hypothetical protein ACPG8W_13580 [Candidatus Promineifilaceae bacterium]
MRNFSELYGVELDATICPTCDRSFLTAADATQRCPHCLDVTLTTIEHTDELPPTPAPELVVPFDVSAEKLTRTIRDFANSYRFTPTDLTPANLQSRLIKQYLPVWLVDYDVSTRWQAEVGFDYEVISHSEAYNGSGWQTTKKRKVRVNWEPRVGELTRHYDNMRAPALDEHDQLVQPLGKFRFWDAVAYDSAEHAQSVLFRLPNREATDAWSDVEPQALQRCEKDCLNATSGQHIRQFHWAPTFSEHHWTSLLLPVYTTYYLDDDQNEIPILIHGNSGKMLGNKVPSLRLAKRASMITVGIALVLLLLFALAAFGILGEGFLPLIFPIVLMGFAAAWPLIYVSNLNSRLE